MELVLSPLVSRLVNSVIDLTKEEVDLLLGVPDEIEKLRRTLRKIQLLLLDADLRRIDDEAVNDSLSHLKDVMYDADDIIDECRIQAEGKPSASSSAPGSRLPPFSSFSGLRSQLQFHREMGSRIRDLDRRLQEMLARMSDFNLSIYSPERRAASHVSRKTSPMVEPDIVGLRMDTDARDMVEALTKEDADANVLVLAIAGIGGIGKTTLAQKVFNDSNVKAQFRPVIWVCVSQEFTETDILRDIIAGAGGDQVQSRAILEPMVEGILRGNKFFLVLDDVWNSQIWEDLLRVPLQSGSQGSRVLVTTRNEGIARRMKAVHIHKMRLLPPEDCWSLLCKKVAMNSDERRDARALKDIGMEIVDKCQGLPLAIKTIGGVLCGRLKRQDWEEVLQSAAWSQTGLPEGVHGALFLSYQDLPSHLKPCFLYCSLFREDYVFSKSDLVRLWIAEGFVQERGNLTMEATAEGYFKELLQRSLLQLQQFSDYKMHDLLRLLGRFLTRDESLVIGDVQRGSIPRAAASTQIRRLSIVAPRIEELKPIISSTKRPESVRTFLLVQARVNQNDLNDNFGNFLRLRVLHLAWTNLQTLPCHIGKLVHLRYLNLSFSCITKLPESIENLINLQFLLLEDCQLESLPKGLIKLSKLRTLDLTEVPVESLPSGIRSLEHLNVLDGFVVNDIYQRDKGCSLEELRLLSELKHLSIRKLERVLVEAGSSRHLNVFKDSQNLEIMHFQCSLKYSHTEEETGRIEKIFDLALHPPTSVRTLRIWNFFGLRFPSWLISGSIISLLPNLSYLELHRCTYCRRLPPLGKLPSLEYLSIRNATAVASIGPEFFGFETANGHEKHPSSLVLFPRLRRLYLKQMQNLEEWRWVEEDQGVAMPRLHELSLIDCPKLSSLPEGLRRHATSLTTLFLGKVSIRSITRFPFLKELTAFGPQDLIISDLSALEVLELYGFWHIISLPEWLTAGPLRFPTLQNLYMEGSNQLLRQCLQDGADWPKIKDVPIVYIKDDRDNYINYIKHSFTFETNLIGGAAAYNKSNYQR